ncbi:MAG: transcription-repair coupling factor [Phycisphaerae bacterium]|nr:transcription-repair coupling factor [Phycisphaerae bacterium]
MELGHDKSINSIVSRLSQLPCEGVVKVSGTWGSFTPLLAAHVYEQLNRPVVYITAHIEDADKRADDLYTFGAKDVQRFAAFEGADIADATDETAAERLRVVLDILNSKNFIVSASVQALCQPIPNPASLEKEFLRLEKLLAVKPSSITSWLVDNGFERVERIDLPGQFAVRGGIIDIYAPLVRQHEGGVPLRIEFFGDEIESIRKIDLDTHLSTEEFEDVSILSSAAGKSEDCELFLNILPQDTLLIVEEPTDVEDVANIFKERSTLASLYEWKEIYESMGRFTNLQIVRFAANDEYIRVDVKSVQQFQRQTSNIWAGHKDALLELVKQSESGTDVNLYCEKQAEIQRIREIIEQSKKYIPKNFHLLTGFVSQGFMLESLNLIVISHHELFGQFAVRRRQRPARASMPIDTLTDLNVGDFVVHTSYGIGKFVGIETIKKHEAIDEFLTVEFADKVKVHVSVKNIALIQKYIGTSPTRPKLSKIGSKKWQNQKEKAVAGIEDMAAELLELQAARHSLGGIAYGADSNWQAEFEESFPYQETADQITAVEDIKADMCCPVAMDRLLCGDVGYGKTELAMRAAFKAVENGKQVAVLVPTTVLCVQHSRTFTERFADFPISIEALNRFRTPKESHDIVERAKAGKVDILIGTHRLLSKDVGFKDLGLLVIDEEQKFGVAHKEKLKKLRINVDILTMTATPIPRTLHISLLGLRDISSLATPPLDRRSVVTNVTGYNESNIKQAIVTELNRQGQVFFLHNRVKSIEKKAWQLENLLKDTGARIAVAHGQMAKSRLEKVMIDFVLGMVDVLVCTTIIESGLDIPNANTIIIDNADRFGLAELHQLRGRVGRYKYRAYAYMLLPSDRPISPIAAKRLKAIEEYSHLGAGFRIALRDLEIRGAGNILGTEQSGHIQVIGYQLYCQLLAEAVARLKNEPLPKAKTAVIDLGFATFIPKNYIPLDRYRMDIYRKIATAATKEGLAQIEAELDDIYGPIPNEVRQLLDTAHIRILAADRGIKSIVVQGQNLMFTFEKETKNTTDLFARVKGKVTLAAPQTVYLRLDKSYFEPATLITILRKILGRPT